MLRIIPKEILLQLQRLEDMSKNKRNVVCTINLG